VGAVCGHGRAGVASNHRGGAVAEGGYQSEGIDGERDPVSLRARAIAGGISQAL
jgi:hypothetical protein